MFSNEVLTHPVAYASALISVVVIARLLSNRYGHGISQIPGPFLASLSDIWRLLLVYRRRPERAHIQLHEKYGSLVRLGPKQISCSDPSVVQVIYALNAGFIKSNF